MYYLYYSLRTKLEVFLFFVAFFTIAFFFTITYLYVVSFMFVVSKLTHTYKHGEHDGFKFLEYINFLDRKPDNYRIIREDNYIEFCKVKYFKTKEELVIYKLTHV